MIPSTNGDLRARFGRAVALLVACVTGACGTSAPRPPGATPVEVRSGSLPGGPPPPRQGLPVPPLDVEWSPPVLVAGDVAALAGVLAEHELLALHGGPRWARTTDIDPLGPLVEAMAPRADIAAVTTGSASELLGHGRLPVVRIERSDAEPPRYQHAEVALADDWNEGREVTGDAEAVLVVDDAPIDLDAWRRLPARSLGGCSEALDALALGQEQSLARLEPFLDHADAVLWRLYRSELEALLPGLEQDLQARVDGAGPTEPTHASDSRAEPGAWEQHRCAVAYRDLVEAHRACVTGTGCTMAPRIFLIGGARIGTAESPGSIPADCAELVGRDVPAELRAAAHDAAQSAQARFDPAWVALADRLGTITEVHAALEDICTPRRRRFTVADLESARGRLARIGEVLASEELHRPGATWRFAPIRGSSVERFHAAGVGSVTQIARYDGGAGSPSRRVLAEARALRQFVLDRAMCRSRDDARPLVAMVIRSNASTPAFVGYFFDEELTCADLGPRLARLGPAD